MFVQHCKLVNRLTTEWQIEISVESQEPCFSQDPKSCNGCKHGLMEKKSPWDKDIQAMWSSYIIAADILLRSWILIEENLRTRTGVLIETPRSCRFSIGWITVYIKLSYSHLQLNHTDKAAIRREDIKLKHPHVDILRGSTQTQPLFGESWGFHCVYLEESMGDPEEAETCHLETWKCTFSWRMMFAMTFSVFSWMMISPYSQLNFENAKLWIVKRGRNMTYDFQTSQPVAKF